MRAITITNGTLYTKYSVRYGCVERKANMKLERNDLVLITRIVMQPNDIWRELSAGCGMSMAAATASREKLLGAGVLAIERSTRGPDTMGRTRAVTLYRVVKHVPFLDDLAKWLDARQSYPWPGPPPERQRALPTRRETIDKAPGNYREPADRVLEMILRNPKATWTQIRDACGVPSVTARHTLGDLLAAEVVTLDREEYVRRDGRKCTRNKYIPNEGKTEVVEMRKRYGLYQRVASFVDPMVKLRELLATTPERSGSPWRVEDVNTEPTLHAQTRVRRET